MTPTTVTREWMEMTSTGSAEEPDRGEGACGAELARTTRAARAPVPLETGLSGVEVAVLDPDEVFHFFHMIASKCWPSPRAPADGGNSRDAAAR